MSTLNRTTMKIQELYYVYHHTDPNTGEIKYVGMGTGSRAWASGTSSGSSRSDAHALWISDLYEQGFTMADIVTVCETLLSKQEALTIESERIKNEKPLFNRIGNQFVCTRYTKVQAQQAYDLFQAGVPYCAIPGVFGLYSSNKSVLGKRMVESGKKYYNE